MKTIDLQLTGMTCAACAARIEKVLNRADGVRAAVNFATETAQVEFDADKATPQSADRRGAQGGLRRRAGGRSVRAARARGAQRGPPLPARPREVRACRGADRAARRADGVHGRRPARDRDAGVAAVRAGDAGAVLGRRPLLSRRVERACAAAPRTWTCSSRSARRPRIVVQPRRVARADCRASTCISRPATVVITLVLLGKLLEGRAKARTANAIRHLLKLQPPTVLRERDGEVHGSAARRACTPATCSSFAPAAAVPVDGRVLTGESAVNEAMLTGESEPVAKAPGDPVLAGTVNETGPAALQGDRRRPGDAARRRSCGRSPRRRDRRRRCSDSPTRCPRGSCRRCSSIAAVTLVGNGSRSATGARR